MSVAAETVLFICGIVWLFFWWGYVVAFHLQDRLMAFYSRLPQPVLILLGALLAALDAASGTFASGLPSDSVLRWAINTILSNAVTSALIFMLVVPGQPIRPARERVRATGLAFAGASASAVAAGPPSSRWVDIANRLLGHSPVQRVVVRGVAIALAAALVLVARGDRASVFRVGWVPVMSFVCAFFFWVGQHWGGPRDGR